MMIAPKRFYTYILMTLMAISLGCATPHKQENNSDQNMVKAMNSQRTLTLLPPEVSLWFDTQGKPLGAYSVILKFDPNVIQIKKVRGGDSYFSGLPFVDKKDFQRGQVRIMAYHPHEAGPAGQILVARIAFKGIQPGLANLELKVETLANTQGDPIEPRPLLSTDSIRVTPQFRQ